MNKLKTFFLKFTTQNSFFSISLFSISFQQKSKTIQLYNRLLEKY